MSFHDRYEIRQDAIWVIANMVETGADHNVRTLVNFECLDALAAALAAMKGPKILMAIMSAIDKIMDVGVKAKINYPHAFEIANGIDYLERIQQHQNQAVHEKAVMILERYFACDDEEDENIAPGQEGGMFSFGINGPAKQLFPGQVGNIQSVNYRQPVLGNTSFHRNNDSKMDYKIQVIQH